MTTTDSAPRAEGVHWDLSPLATSADDCRTRLAAAIDDCRAFESRYRGQIAAFDGATLADALAELCRIENELGRLHSYTSLRESVDVSDPENQDLDALMDRSMVEAANALRFFELEWLELDDALADGLANAPEVAGDRHHLLAERRFKRHMLSEPEERMLGERSPAAASAWQSLFGRITSTLETDFDSGDGTEPHTIDRLLACVRNPDRDLRMRALDTLYATLGPNTPTLAHCYDTLVGDRLAMDRLRNYDDPMDPTHLRNEVPGPAIETMMSTVEGHYGLAHRWFRVKARLLGLDRLHLADQYAPLGEAREVLWPEARTIIDSSFRAFSPRIGDIADGFFAEQRIDAEPRTGKRGGAFCASVAQDAQPFMLMNYTDRMDDVMTLAHELGHGMHFTLAAERQTALSFHTGLALAEVPSTFAEMIAFDHLLANEADEATRTALVCERVEGSFATVFRQTVLARYEQEAYRQRGGGTTLTDDRLSTIWWDQNAAYYGDAVEMPEGYRLGWSYIPHFISTRFYTYAYVFAHLVTLALYAQYRAQGEEFVPKYLDFLAAGGSASPADLLRPLGVDLDDRACWEPGFAEMERMVTRAEEMTA